MLSLELDIPTAAWALPLLEPARYKGASGGRSSGKSHFFAERAVEEMVCDPDLRFVCIREVQRSLKFSAKALVESKIRTLGVEHLFDILTTEIRRKGGRGIMIFEGMQDHTADSIKSLEGFRLAWVEEAQSISKRSLDLLLPTIRVPKSEIWFSWNPDQPNDPVDAFFADGPEGSVHVHTTYAENPFCPDVMKTEAGRLQRADPNAFEHIWGGGHFLGGKGRVYSSFLNKPWPEGNVDESIEDTGAELLVGMDFNVNPMSAVIAVRARDECLVIDALEIETSNTEEMADELKRRYPKRTIIVCPDAAGKRHETSAPVGQTDFTILERAGFELRAPNANPLVVDRENNANAMYLDRATQRRRARIHPCAKPLLTALANLTYKEGTSQRDKKSSFVHLCFTAGTPVFTDRGEVPIEDIRPGDCVLTRWGFFPVSASAMTHPDTLVSEVEMADGRRITATPDHPFWIRGEGFVPLSELTCSATLFECQSPNAWSIAASPSADTRSPRTHRIATTSRRAARSARLASGGSTRKSGRMPTGRFLTATTSTTGTATRSTTRSIILGASPDRGTSRDTPSGRTGCKVAERPNTLGRSSIYPQSGIVPRWAGRGTESMDARRGRNASPWPLSACGAEPPPRSSSFETATSALRSAKLPSVGRPASMMRTGRALGAERPFASIDTERPAPVHGVAARIYAIRPAGSAPVFNLTVDGPHEYFAGGVLVSNCDAMDYLLWQEFNLLEDRVARRIAFRV